MPSSVEFILTFFSIISANAIANPMVRNWTLPETNKHFCAIKPKAVICVQGCSNFEILRTACSQLSIPLFCIQLDLAFQKIQVPKIVRRIAIRINTQLSNVKPIVNIFRIGIDSPHNQDNSIAKSDNVGRSPLTTAAILSTHATTGAPKLVPLSHAAILESIENTTKVLDLGPIDCTILLLPLYHSHGLIGVLLSTFISGGTVILESEFSYGRFWSDASQYQASWVSATPWMHRQILKARRRSLNSLHFSLRFIQSTGSPLEENLLLEIEQTYGAEVITSYSLTEASHLTTTNIPKRTRKLGSVGSPVNGISCMIVNEKNEKVPSGIGEICICGPTVFKGYFGKEKGGNFFEYDKRTWFKTGDLGWLDERGFLNFAGRRSDMIMIGDTYVSGILLDKVLGTHPSVSSVAFFQSGGALKAAVVLKEGALASEDDLKSWMNSLLPNKLPDRIQFLPELPRTEMGKIQRFKLMQIDAKL